jgi:hypothetical protein
MSAAAPLALIGNLVLGGLIFVFCAIVVACFLWALRPGGPGERGRRPGGRE